MYNEILCPLVVCRLATTSLYVSAFLVCLLQSAQPTHASIFLPTSLVFFSTHHSELVSLKAVEVLTS